ncbi:MAG: hypothetical protein LBN24_09065, partial [Mediterranea sp.]|nr:hypothetical protein [Mediterranea sp.]
TNEIPDNATAPGLNEARQMLKINQMSQTEQRAYWRHVDNVNLLASNVYTEREEGRWEGLAEGEAIGEAKALAQITANAAKAKAQGIPNETIALVTGLSIEEIEKL